jgi:hypothetical protein
MSDTADTKIAEILKKYGEPLAGNIWRVQGQAVIYHKTLERIAAQAGIAFDPPQVLRAERDEAVILVTGRLGDRSDWSIGEAVINVNYRVSGRQAAYVYAMSEKRAKDRVILKLIGLHGLLYSEEEADDLGKGKPSEDDARPNGAEPLAGPPTAAATPAKAKRPLAPITVNGEQVEPEKSAHQARKDDDWPKFMADLQKHSGGSDILLRWVPSRLDSLQKHPWYGKSLEAWREALVAALADECHSEREIDHWKDANAERFRSLPLDWRLAGSGAVEDAIVNLRCAQPQDAAE